MRYVLGIDTGGTYTDAVIIDPSDNSIICKSKAPTTHRDLSLGIGAAITSLGFEKNSGIDRVHLSTTVAANSILEKNFERCGLLQIGRDADCIVPAGYFMTIKKPNLSHDNINKCKINEMSEIKKMFSGNVENIVVTSHDGDMECEIMVTTMIKRELGIKALSATRLWDHEDYRDRTVATLLSTHLMPVVDDLINGVRTVMAENDINAEVFIVNALGGLMSCDEARAKPLSTVFSGLATSVKGGIALTDESDFLLIDMGGTSSDVTRVVNREFREIKKNAKIDVFNINEDTMDIKCYGIGGDSHIRITHGGRIDVGPGRAEPLCRASEEFPHLIHELKKFKRPLNYEMVTAQDVDCYMGSGIATVSGLTVFEQKIVEYIAKMPHNIFQIAEHFNVDPDALHMDRLVRKDAARLISFTPTDILHAEGRFSRWDKSASDAAVRIMSDILGISRGQFLEKINDEVTKRLAEVCMQGIAAFEEVEFDFDNHAGATFLLEHFFDEEAALLEMGFTINKPIVALGAPARAWLDQVAKKLSTIAVYPEHGEVANAYGASIATRNNDSSIAEKKGHER